MSDAPPAQILNEKREESPIKGPEDTIATSTSSDALMSDVSPAQMASEKREGSPLENPDEKRRKAADEMTFDQLNALDWKTMTVYERSRWSEEYKKKERLMHPWWDETGRLLSEPPDINYRRIIFNDKEKIERLLADHDMHYKDRCLRYRTLDLQIQKTLIQEYKMWCDNMGADVEEDGGRRSFFSNLGSALSDDSSVVHEEVMNSRHDVEMFRAKKAVEDGSQRFFHRWRRCWYYLDELRQDWLVEPTRKCLLYDERLKEWRREALAKTERRYFNFAENRFYIYDQEQDGWQAEGPDFSTWDSMLFEYDNKTGQWRAPQWLLDYLTRKERTSQALPQAQRDQEGAEQKEAGNEGDTTKEDISSQSFSVDTQAELDAQLVTTLHEA